MKDLKGLQLPTLSDGRLVVRPWRPDDAAAVFEACQDPEIARWTKLIPQPYEMYHATGFLAEAWRQWVESRTAGFAVVVAGDRDAEADGDDDVATGVRAAVAPAGTGLADLRRVSAAYGGFLGAIGLDIDIDSEVGEFGYWIAPWARRRGVATGAVRLVAAWGLDELGLGRVADPVPDRQRRLAPRRRVVRVHLRGRPARRLIQRGARVDTGIASLLATDPRPW